MRLGRWARCEQLEHRPLQGSRSHAEKHKELCGWESAVMFTQREILSELLCSCHIALNVFECVLFLSCQLLYFMWFSHHDSIDLTYCIFWTLLYDGISLNCISRKMSNVNHTPI